MKILERLKRWFPKPHIPQKRYLVMGAILLYCALKLYVAYTPSPIDDDVPDKVKEVIDSIYSPHSVKLA